MDPLIKHIRLLGLALLSVVMVSFTSNVIAAEEDLNSSIAEKNIQALNGKRLTSRTETTVPQAPSDRDLKAPISKDMPTRSKSRPTTSNINSNNKTKNNTKPANPSISNKTRINNTKFDQTVSKKSHTNKDTKLKSRTPNTSPIIKLNTTKKNKSKKNSRNKSKNNKSITINLQDADIGDLVQWASDVTGKTMIVHRNVKGKVTVLAGKESMTEEEAYEVFLKTLQTYGFSAIETPEAIKILPDGSARSTTTPVVDSRWDSTGGVMVVRVLKPKNVQAQQLVTVLRPLVAQVGHLVAFAATNALIIADRADNVERIMEIINRIDEAGSIDIDIIPLEHANASELISTLKNLLPNDSKNKNNQANTGIQLAADDRTNSILLSGDVIKRQQVKTLILRLDTPLPGEGNTQVIYVHYLKAKDLVNILEGIANSRGGSGSKRSNRNKKDLSSGNRSNEVHIMHSEENNALIVTAPAGIMKDLKQIISKLDIRRPQVLVEAIIVEVSYDDKLDLGINWFSDANIGTDDGIFSGVNVLGGTLEQGITNPQPDTGIVDATILDGLTLGFYRKGSLRSILRALATDKSVNLLSTPTLVVLENEEARILVGSTVPFITGQRDTGSGNNTNNNLFTTIQRQDIGIELKVTPQINEGDAIILDIEQKVENVSTNPTAGAADLQTDKREIKTKILLEDDGILVLGGLIRDDITENHNKVPLLGEIPYIGKIFQSKKTEVFKTNLMVFIHAKILRDGMISDDVTQKRYNLMRKKQQSFVEDLNKLDRFSSDDAPLLEEFETIFPGKNPAASEQEKEE